MVPEVDKHPTIAAWMHPAPVSGLQFSLEQKNFVGFSSCRKFYHLSIGLKLEHPHERMASTKQVMTAQSSKSINTIRNNGKFSNKNSIYLHQIRLKRSSLEICLNLLLTP